MVLIFHALFSFPSYSSYLFILFEYLIYNLDFYIKTPILIHILFFYKHTIDKKLYCFILQKQKYIKILFFLIYNNLHNNYKKKGDNNYE